MASRESADGGFPGLSIVPTQQLLLHEEVDMERVARLLDRLSADGILKNPPIVASLSESDRFMLLDGANRVSAMENLEIPHLLVQVEKLDDPRLEVRHWNHVVRDIETEKLLDQVADVEGVTVREGRPEDAVDETPGYLASILTSETKAIHLWGAPRLQENTGALKALTEIYSRGDARMERVNHADVATIRHHHPHFGAVVSFANFTKQDVLAVAETDERLPSGITRFLVPRRVLGFNLRLPLLKSNLPLEEKNRWLQDEIHHKVTEHKVRYYQEPTFVFDD